MRQFVLQCLQLLLFVAYQLGVLLIVIADAETLLERFDFFSSFSILPGRVRNSPWLARCGYLSARVVCLVAVAIA